MFGNSLEGMEPHRMTWADFKKHVEDAGVKDSSVLLYLDVNIGVYDKSQIHVRVDSETKFYPSSFSVQWR